MRFLVALLVSVLSLLPILSFADNEGQAEKELRAQRTPLVKFEQCESHMLLIQLNVAGRTPKADLVEALKILPDYPDLTFTPVRAERTAIAYTATTVCGNSRCASDAGFTEVQRRLARYKGVAITCYEPPMGGEEQQEEQPKQDDGGVTGGN